MTPGPFPQPAIGTTVTLRVETSVGAIGVVGVLVAANPGHWSVRRRDGSVTVVDTTRISAGRVVPPGRAATATVEEVERIGALGWRGLEMQRLGDWLLRTGGGFTGRANSTLALGDPGLPLDAALDAVQEWYAARDLPARLLVPDDGIAPGLVDLLDGAGWGSSTAVHVMTAELGHVLRAVTGTTELETVFDDAPDAAWLACYRRADGLVQAAATAILVNHPAVVFASLRDGDRAVAIARAAVDERWAGLFTVEVAAEHRGRGLGAIVSAAALRWAGQRGARRTYLQVSTDNPMAVGLYERLGYAVHHNYVYRQPPGS